MRCVNLQGTNAYSSNLIASVIYFSTSNFFMLICQTVIDLLLCVLLV